MAPLKNDWVYRFEIDNPLRYNKGFTVYRLASVLYPRNAPEAVTRLVVWKRYNDFKSLLLKTKEECKKLKITDSPPQLPSASYFKRFDENVIRARITSAKALLNFIAKHKALFLSDSFRKFCEEGYQVEDKFMGQAPISTQNVDTCRDDSHWKCCEDMGWLPDQDSCSLRSESSYDGSVSASETAESGGSRQSPAHNNNLPPVDAKRLSQVQSSNNNNTSAANGGEGFNHNNGVSASLRNGEENKEDFEVEDPAGPGSKPMDSQPPDDDSEVVCLPEHPLPANERWVAVAAANDRLDAYRIVGILDPVLVVTHRAFPSRQLVLKVLRKNSWPTSSQYNAAEPRPVPHMVRLFDFIETDDAIFVVMEHVPRGLLWDHVRRLQDRRSPVHSVPSSDLEVDLLVANAQELLASVSRTLRQSNAATTNLNKELESVESTLSGRGHKPRSASAFPRPRLERRLSCDDMPGHRPRTAHGSLDRAVHWARLPETTVREWASSLVVSLETLHSRGVVWRDLYPGNLLVGEGGRLILTFQHQWHGVERRLHRVALAGLFVAPEARSVFPVSTAADWWSVGVILYELLTGVALINVHPCGLGTHTTLELPEFLSVEAKSLLKEFLQVEPTDRLGSGVHGSEDIKCHPFFHHVDWVSKGSREKCS